MERTQERFEAPKGLCVTYSTSDAPNITRLAEIIDMSMGGLAIAYRSRRNNTEGLAKLTILTGNERSASGVTLPCRGVYDCELPRKRCNSISPIRRCGVEFGSLSKRQIRLVKNFIRDHLSENLPYYANRKILPQSSDSCGLLMSGTASLREHR